MALESIRLETLLPATAEEIYAAWLDSDAHGDFTGASAEIDPRVGGMHSAWDGYILGRTLALEPPSKIEQSWRATDFPAEADDSLLVVTLQNVPEGCLLTLEHSQIPEGLGQSFEQGWEDHYFTPMRAYFAEWTAKGGAGVPAKKGKKTAPIAAAPAAKKGAKVVAKKPAAKKGAKVVARKPAAKKGAKIVAKKPAAKKGAKVVAKKPAAKKGAKVVAKKPVAKKGAKVVAKKPAAKKGAKKSPAKRR